MNCQNPPDLRLVLEVAQLPALALVLELAQQPHLALVLELAQLPALALVLEVAQQPDLALVLEVAQLLDLDLVLEVAQQPALAPRLLQQLAMLRDTPITNGRVPKNLLLSNYGNPLSLIEKYYNRN